VYLSRKFKTRVKYLFVIPKKQAVSASNKINEFRDPEINSLWVVDRVTKTFCNNLESGNPIIKPEPNNESLSKPFKDIRKIS
jgi:hypothetical protein